MNTNILSQTTYSLELQHHLFGRQLLATEIPFSEEILHAHVQTRLCYPNSWYSKQNLSTLRQSKQAFILYVSMRNMWTILHILSVVHYDGAGERVYPALYLGRTATQPTNTRTSHGLVRHTFRMDSKPHPTESNKPFLKTKKF